MASVVKVAFGRLVLWPALRHGPAGTIAGLAIVLGEGADCFSCGSGPVTACHQPRPDAASII